MLELNFDPAKCAACKTQDCLVKCQYLHLDKDKAKTEMQKIINGEDSFVLRDCATCYACEEYCKMGNHPFYLIVERQEEKGILPAPRSIATMWVNQCEPRGRFTVGKVEERALSFCSIPIFPFWVTGKLFDGIASSYIMGEEFFCNAVFLHYAKMSVIKDRLPKAIENIKNLGIKELICLHDECYGTFNSLAPAYGMEVPFKTTHYFEYLHNKLKELKDEIKPLNVKVAYQRPCSNRLSPKTQHFVDDIFNLIGAHRVKREYVGENALCCGEVIRMGQGYKIADDVQKRNMDDMVNAGAEYCVFNCPMCYLSISDKVTKRGLKPIHIIDLCKMAIDEKPRSEV